MQGFTQLQAVSLTLLRRTVASQWTPALSPNGEHLPHGMIFSCFMASSMVGSALAGRVLGRRAPHAADILAVLLPACCSGVCWT
jgi:Sugar-tranasporters, 12 TM